MQLANLIFLCFGLRLALGACGGGKSPAAPASGTSAAAAPSSLKEQIDKLEDSGQLPKLDRSTSIAGPDTNSNGVRDDIETYIAGLPITEIQKKAAIQKARALQMTLAVNLTDKTALRKVGDALMASTNCVGDIDPTSSDYRNMIRQHRYLASSHWAPCSWP